MVRVYPHVRIDERVYWTLEIWVREIERLQKRHGFDPVEPVRDIERCIVGVRYTDCIYYVTDTALREGDVEDAYERTGIWLSPVPRATHRSLST